MAVAIQPDLLVRQLETAEIPDLLITAIIQQGEATISMLVRHLQTTETLQTQDVLRVSPHRDTTVTTLTQVSLAIVHLHSNAEVLNRSIANPFNKIVNQQDRTVLLAPDLVQLLAILLLQEVAAAVEAVA